MAATQTSAPAGSPANRAPVPLTTLFTPPASCLNVVTYDGTSFWQNGLAQTGDAGCYPSGFTNVCASLISEDLTNVWSRSSLAPGPMPNNQPLTTVKKADIKSNTVWADVIQVRWQSTNTKIINLLAQKTASSSKNSGTSGTGSPSSSSGSSTTKATSTPKSENKNSGGLSTGAEAGIGIAAALIAVVLAVGAYLLLRNRRRKSKATARYGASTVGGGIKPPGYHEMEQKDAGHPPPAELDGGNVVELAGSEARVEMGHR
ncbi:hypothetical protein ACLMJK_007385 [Lecanora helva]